MQPSLTAATDYFRVHCSSPQNLLALIKNALPEPDFYQQIFNSPYADGYAEKVNLTIQYMELSDNHTKCDDFKVTAKSAQEIDPAGQFLGWDTLFFTPTLLPFVGSNLGSDYPYWVFSEDKWWYVGNFATLFKLSAEQIRAEIDKLHDKKMVHNAIRIKKKPEAPKQAVPETLKEQLESASDCAAYLAMMNEKQMSLSELEQVFDKAVALFLSKYQNEAPAIKSLGMLQLYWKTGGINAIKIDQELKGFQTKLLPNASVYNVYLVVTGGSAAGFYAGTWAKINEQWRCFKL